MVYNFFLKMGLVVFLSCVLSSFSFAMNFEDFDEKELKETNFSPKKEGSTFEIKEENSEDNFSFQEEKKEKKEKQKRKNKESSHFEEGKVGYWQSFKQGLSSLLSSLTSTFHTCFKVFKSADLESKEELLLNSDNNFSLKAHHDFDHTFFDERTEPRYLMKWCPWWLRNTFKGILGLGESALVPIGMAGITNYVMGTFFGYEVSGAVSGTVAGVVMFLNVDIAFIKGWNLGDFLLEKKKTHFKVATSQELKHEENFPEARIFPLSKSLIASQVCGAVLEALVPTAVVVFIYDGVPAWQIPIAIAFMVFYGIDYGKKCIKESNDWRNDRYKISNSGNRRMRQELCASLKEMKKIIENDKHTYFIQLKIENSNEKSELLQEKEHKKKDQTRKTLIRVFCKETALFCEAGTQKVKKIEKSSYQKDEGLNKETYERFLNALNGKKKIQKKDEEELLRYLISCNYIDEPGAFTTQLYLSIQKLTKNFGHNKNLQAIQHDELASPSSALFLKMQTAIEEVKEKSEVGTYKRAFNSVLTSALDKDEGAQEDFFLYASIAIAGANIYPGLLMEQKAIDIISRIPLKLVGFDESTIEIAATVISYTFATIVSIRLIPETSIYRSTLRKWSKPLTFDPIDHKGWRGFFGVKSFFYSLASSSTVLVLASWALDIITMPTKTTSSSINIWQKNTFLLLPTFVRYMLLFLSEGSNAFNKTITAIKTRPSIMANTLEKKEAKLYDIIERLQNELRYRVTNPTATQIHNETFGSL